MTNTAQIPYQLKDVMAVLDGDVLPADNGQGPGRTFREYWSSLRHAVIRTADDVSQLNRRMLESFDVLPPKLRKVFLPPERELALQKKVTIPDPIVFEKHAERVRSFLVMWVNEWLKAGSNTAALLEKRGDIDAALRSFLATQKTMLLRSTSGPSELALWTPIKMSAREEAARLFFSLLTHPKCDHLAKCDRCGRLYLKATRRANKRFCNRRCGNAATKQRPSRIKDENATLQKLKDAARRYPGSPSARSGDWKRWLSQETGVTLHWITRRERQGVIEGPQLKENRNSKRRAHATR